MMPVPEYNVETVNSGTKASGHRDHMRTHADFYKLRGNPLIIYIPAKLTFQNGVWQGESE